MIIFQRSGETALLDPGFMSISLAGVLTNLSMFRGSSMTVHTRPLSFEPKYDGSNVDTLMFVMLMRHILGKIDACSVTTKTNSGRKPQKQLWHRAP